MDPGVGQGRGACEAICLSDSVEPRIFTGGQVCSEIDALCAWEWDERRE